MNGSPMGTFFSTAGVAAYDVDNGDRRGVEWDEGEGSSSCVNGSTRRPSNS